MLDESTFCRLRLSREPFPHVTHTSKVFASDSLTRLAQEFPEASAEGYLGPQDLTLSRAWNQWLAYLKSASYRSALERIVEQDLTDTHVEVGFRTVSGASEGSIHTDIPQKRITHLIYWNQEWEYPTGRLRLLRSPQIDDFSIEVVPTLGTGVIFLVSEHSFHGFLPFVGVRKVLQINTMNGPETI